MAEQQHQGENVLVAGLLLTVAKQPFCFSRQTATEHVRDHGWAGVRLV